MTEREMNDMKKDYLRGYKRVCDRIKTLNMQIKELRETKEAAKAVEYSDVPRGHKQSDLSDYIVKLEQLEERVSEKLEEKQIEKLDIEATITDIDDDVQSNILYKHYIMLKGWEEIADEIGYSTRQVLRYHGKALHNMKYDYTEKDVT